MGSPKTDIAFFKEIEQMERRLFNKFVLHNRIGHGSFGELYCGEDLQTHEKVAIKMEHYQTRPPQLYYEMKIYRVLNGGVGIPCLKWYGVQDQYNVMVIDLLDVSLEELFRKCSFRFSLKTVLMLADQMLERIQFIHCRGVIHRDVKPDNFVLGMGDNANLLYMIDFGLARSYRDSRTGEHIPYRDSRALTGTARYASVNVHAGIEPSRRDDLESLAYVLIYFMRGDLPWQSVRIDSESARLRVIGDVKERMAADKLCAGMPDEFLWFLNEVRSLEFAEEPKYSLYRSRFRELFIKSGFVYDYQYDWATTETGERRFRFGNPGEAGKREPYMQQLTSIKTHIPSVKWSGSERMPVKPKERQVRTQQGVTRFVRLSDWLDNGKNRLHLSNPK